MEIRIKSDLHNRSKYPKYHENGAHLTGSMRDLAGEVLKVKIINDKGDTYAVSALSYAWHRDWYDEVHDITDKKIAQEMLDEGSLTSDEYFAYIKELNKDE